MIFWLNANGISIDWAIFSSYKVVLYTDTNKILESDFLQHFLISANIVFSQKGKFNEIYEDNLSQYKYNKKRYAL